MVGAALLGSMALVPPVAGAAATAGCRPEPGMQGQVPASDANKDNGYCLNAEILAIHPIQAGSSRGGMARFGQCVYVGSAIGKAADGSQAGLAAVDLSDPRRPKVVQIVPGVASQWNTTHVNERRKIVVAKTPNGFQSFSIDPSTCKLAPRGAFGFSALGPTAVPGLGTGRIGAQLGADSTHEFEVSPDGRTVVASFSGGDTEQVPGVDDDETVFDIADLDHPSILTTFSPATMLNKNGTAAHDFDFSPDGSRLYIGMSVGDMAVPPNSKHPLWDGVMITDISQINARKPDAQPRLISYLPKAGGHTVRYAKIAGHPYLLTNYEIDCLMGVPAYTPAGVDIVDIANEKRPAVVGHFTLEVNASAENCMATRDDKTSVWAHFANVDDPRNASMYFVDWTSSGLRVIDIRNPRKPREIAYANPVRNGATAYSYPIYDPKTRIVTYADTKNGLVVVKLGKTAASAPSRVLATPKARDRNQVSRLQATLPLVSWYCRTGQEDPLALYAAQHH